MRRDSPEIRKSGEFSYQNWEQSEQKRTRQQTQQQAKSLNRVLSMIQRGPVTIQSEKVKYLDDIEDHNQTQIGSKSIGQNNHSMIDYQNTSDLDAVKKRTDSKILKWKSQKGPRKTAFLD